MSKPSKKPAAVTWGWRKWIDRSQPDVWNERLQAAGAPPWVVTELPGRSRLLLEIYSEKRSPLVPVFREFGGQLRSIRVDAWLKPVSAPPLILGNKLEIVHEKTRARATIPRLCIPHGMAFGSGDHSTTLMLLRALTHYDDWDGTTVLDLGTGSGVLALTARLFGAKKIVATDFDPDAIRVARENEDLNFPKSVIRWQCSEVKLLRPKLRYKLVLANLFSEILCQAATQIAGSVAPGGQLWQSGILRTQREQVIAAYRRQGLKLDRTVSRGKWVLLQWVQPRR